MIFSPYFSTTGNCILKFLLVGLLLDVVIVMIVLVVMEFYQSVVIGSLLLAVSKTYLAFKVPSVDLSHLVFHALPQGMKFTGMYVL